MSNAALVISVMALVLAIISVIPNDDLFNKITRPLDPLIDRLYRHRHENPLTPRARERRRRAFERRGR